jgi:hypothetical protein
MVVAYFNMQPLHFQAEARKFVGQNRTRYALNESLDRYFLDGRDANFIPPEWRSHAVVCLLALCYSDLIETMYSKHLLLGKVHTRHEFKASGNRNKSFHNEGMKPVALRL